MLTSSCFLEVSSKSAFAAPEKKRKISALSSDVQESSKMESEGVSQAKDQKTS